LKYIWRSFQPRLSFPRPFQQSLACFRVARSPNNSWASCSHKLRFIFETFSCALSSQFIHNGILWEAHHSRISMILSAACEVAPNWSNMRFLVSGFVLFNIRGGKRIYPKNRQIQACGIFLIYGLWWLVYVFLFMLIGKMRTTLSLLFVSYSLEINLLISRNQFLLPWTDKVACPRETGSVAALPSSWRRGFHGRQTTTARYVNTGCQWQNTAKACGIRSDGLQRRREFQAWWTTKRRQDRGKAADGVNRPPAIADSKQSR